MNFLSALRMGVLGGVLVCAWSCTAIVGVGDYKSGDGNDAAGSTGVDSGCPTPLCNGACCASSEICIKTSNGIDACAQSCASDYALTATCSGSTPCCNTLTNDTDGGSMWNGNGVCLAATSPNEGVCLCTTSTECAGESCAPWPSPTPLGGAYSLCDPCTADSDLTCSDADSYGYQCAEPFDPTALDSSLNCSAGVADPDGVNTDFCCTLE